MEPEVPQLLPSSFSHICLLLAKPCLAELNKNKLFQLENSLPDRCLIGKWFLFVFGFFRETSFTGFSFITSWILRESKIEVGPYLLISCIYS